MPSSLGPGEIHGPGEEEGVGPSGLCLARLWDRGVRRSCIHVGALAARTVIGNPSKPLVFQHVRKRNDGQERAQ